MMKPLLAALLTLSGFAHAAEPLTIYTHRHYDADTQLYNKFTEKTGIPVKIVKANADQLIQRLAAEGDSSPADLLMTVDAGRLVSAKAAGVFTPVKSEILEKAIPAKYRDADGHWFSITVRSRVIVYNKETIDPDKDLSTYADLTHERWDGRLLARSSSNIYNQSLLASIIAAEGEEKALDWASAVRKNMARAPRGNDRDQIRAVAAGYADLALANTYYLGVLQNSDDEKDREVFSKVGVFFPDQDGRGAHINVSRAGIVKSSQNKENAIKLLEFLASPESQKIYASVNFEFPIDPAQNTNELLKSWGDFKRDAVPLSKLGELNKTAIRIFDRARWELSRIHI